MKKISKLIIYGLGLLLLIPEHLGATSYTWTGAISSDWYNSGNWSPSGVPGTGDDVAINSGMVTLGGGSVDLAGLVVAGGTLGVSSGASLSLSGTCIVNAPGTLNVSGSITLNSNLDIVGTLIFGVGNISGSSDLIIHGTMIWNSTSAAVTLTGDFTNNGTIDIAGGANLQTTLMNFGTINQTANFLFGNNGRVINLATYDFTGNGDVAYSSVNNGGIMNQGTILKTGGSLTSDITVNLDNNGTIDAQTGRIKLSGSGIHGGDFNSTSPGYISFSGSTDTLVGGNSFGGSGMTSLDNSSVFLMANCTATNLKMTAGTLFGDGDMTISGAFEWLGGSLGDGAHPTGQIALNGTFLIAGGDFIRCEVINNATTTWTNGSWTMGDLAHFTNYSTMDIQTNSDIFTMGSPNGIYNYGTITKSAGTTTTQIYPVMNNNGGTINVQSGEIRLMSGGFNTGDIFISAGAVVGITGSNQFTNLSSGGIEGHGEVNSSAGNLVNHGFYRPGSSPGVLTVTGSVSLSDSTVFEMEVGGTTAGTGYDHLILNNTTTLDGELRLQTIGGFIPAIGDTFVIIDYSSINGWFDTILGCTDTNDRKFTIIDNGSEILAIVAATPPLTSFNENICQGDSVMIFGQFQSVAGIYYDTLQTSLGCDSVLVSTLSVNTINTMVNQFNDTLMAAASGVSYQWYDCDLGAPIPGQTGVNYIATVNGNYAVIIGDSSCSDTSACYLVTSVGKMENEQVFLHIYPNPAQDQINIRTDMTPDNLTLTIFDTQGREIRALGLSDPNSQVSVADLAPGHYIFTISNRYHLQTRPFIIR